MEHAGESSSAQKKKIIIATERKWRSFDCSSDMVNVSGVDVTPGDE